MHQPGSSGWFLAASSTPFPHVNCTPSESKPPSIRFWVAALRKKDLERRIRTAWGRTILARIETTRFENLKEPAWNLKEDEGFPMLQETAGKPSRSKLGF